MSGSVEVFFTLDRDAAPPLRVQLEGQIRQAIRGGRLRDGDRLPSSRSLADDLGVSRGLVQDCYEQLVAEGYLISAQGSGTRVSPTAIGPEPRAVPSVQPLRTRGLMADFESGVPDLGAAPRADWAWAIREVCRTAPNSAFGYGDPLGDPTVRAAVAGYARRVRSADVEAARVMMCSGVAQGIAVALQALGPRVVAFEDPGQYRTVLAAAAASGSTAVAVPVDDRGLDVDALSRTDARAVLVTPAHQWPTGVVLAPERRLALIAWAREKDAVILEDDYDAEFRYDRDPIGALQGLAPDRVISFGTVSKSLAPVLRLGWALFPAQLAESMAVAKRIADRGTAGLDQLALALLLESGRYDRHLRRMRAEYSDRRDTLVAALAEYAPSVRLSGLAAGFHAVAHLPAQTDVSALLAAARDRGVGLHRMGVYYVSRDIDPPQLVLGFGNLSSRSIRAGIRTVADLLV